MESAEKIDLLSTEKTTEKQLFHKAKNDPGKAHEISHSPAENCMVFGP
ncbi:MAG: hypothetical protein FD123_2746 [Bacteroidetes bacterium]|nr:MAG: hypothetical protein FD123_2746 [Bacteroidota bacterium]